MICGGTSRFAKYWVQMAEANTSILGVGQRLALLGGEDRRQDVADARRTSAAAGSAARRAASSAFQSRAALAAASKAASSCWRVHSGAWANTSPVAGLRTSKVPSVGAASPAMVMTKSDMALLDLLVAGMPPPRTGYRLR